MRIEDYWLDGIIYEVEYQVAVEELIKTKSDFILCMSELDEVYVIKLGEKVIRKKYGDVRFSGITELYDCLMEKHIYTMKKENPLTSYSLYQINFTVMLNKSTKEIEKSIILESNMSQSTISELVRIKFSNVVKINTILQLEKITLV